MIHPLEFKSWLENCIKDGIRQGLSEEDILFTFMDETKLLMAKFIIKVSKLKRDNEQDK